MRFTQTLFAGAALVAAAMAQLAINDFPASVEAGESYTITYSGGEENAPTTFILRQGANENLDTITTLTTSATGGSFTWVVDDSLVDATDYALEIQQEGSEPNFIGPIALTGGETASATPSPTATVSASVTGSDRSSSTVSGSISLTTGLNGTISSATLTRTASNSAATADETASSTTTGTGAPEETGAASLLSSSPLALIFGAVAAMVYLN